MQRNSRCLVRQENPESALVPCPMHSPVLKPDKKNPPPNDNTPCATPGPVGAGKSLEMIISTFCPDRKPDRNSGKFLDKVLGKVFGSKVKQKSSKNS